MEHSVLWRSMKISGQSIYHTVNYHKRSKNKMLWEHRKDHLTQFCRKREAWQINRSWPAKGKRKREKRQGGKVSTCNGVKKRECQMCPKHCQWFGTAESYSVGWGSTDREDANKIDRENPCLNELVSIMKVPRLYPESKGSHWWIFGRARMGSGFMSGKLSYHIV